MNWETAIVLGVLLFIVTLVTIRAEPHTRRWIILVLPLPTAVLIYRWVKYEHAWIELASAAAIAALGTSLWWAIIGRRLPPPAKSATRVWTKEDPF